MSGTLWHYLFKSLWGKIWRGGKKQSHISSSPPPPWDSWDLDPKFFAALSRWTLQHPTQSLDHILEKVCIGIERGKDIVELIPNSPFPASGLIGALAHLVKLGATVSKAKRDVQVFAREIVHWVSEMKFAFEQGGRGRFTSKTRKNLEEMRALIDEICKWATARLDDGRWSRIGHGLTIAKEIDEFKSRIASARAIFTDLSLINLAQGQDTVVQSVRELIDIIQRIQLDQLSSILDEMEAQKQAEARRQFLSQILSTRAISNTAYDDQGKRPCDSDTRVDILADIKQWVYDISDGAQCFLWLTGDPGSGKSAITASIARECKDTGILWAQFFINRNLGNTTNPASYFPSIARQLADRSPDVALAIHDTLKERPSLMDDISQLQAGKLFVDSLKVASSTDKSKPVVIIIDGLDETDTTRLRSTAEIFSKALVDLPSNVKVFISSRTEDDIRKPFAATFHVKHVKHIHLDTAAESSIRDVSTFLVRNIAEIADENGLDLLQWPGEDRMQTLCKQASGLFIWAVTTVKFIQDQVEISGKECLNDVLDELNAKGMGDINVLYSTILRITHRNQTDSWVFERFRRIVGCIVVLQEPLCIADITALLSLRKNATSVPVDVEHHVRRLRTVLVAGADAVDGRTIPRLHKSFFEFITSPRVDDHFRIDLDKANGEVAVQCLHQLAHLSDKSVAATNDETSSPSKTTKPDGSYFPPHCRYAFQFSNTHFSQLEATAVAGVAIAGSFGLQERQALSRHSVPAAFCVAFLPDKRRLISSSDNIIRLWDARTGGRIESPVTLHFDEPTSPSATFSLNGGPDFLRSLSENSEWSRIYNALLDQPKRELLGERTGFVQSVAFSPDGSLVVLGSEDGTLGVWDARSGQTIREPFKGHTQTVQSIAFSPDGNLIATGSADATFCVRDARSGQAIREPFRGDTGGVTSVAFSPDGSRVISGSVRGSVYLWDTQSGQRLTTFGELHSGAVHCVAFSPDGSQVVSGSTDRTLRLLDVRSGRSIGQPLKGHAGIVQSVAFSPDGNFVVSGSWDKTVCIWDTRTSQLIGKPSRGHTRTVECVAFSPDGSLIASVSLDNTLRLWDGRSGNSIAEPFDCPAHFLRSVAFSLDGKEIVSGGVSGIIFHLDVASRQPFAWPITNQIDQVTAIALSPDCNVMVSATSVGMVCLWDVRSGLPIGSPIGNNFKEIVSLVFSPDGSRIAAAALGGTISLWDTEIKELLISYRQSDHIKIDVGTSITFSAEGKNLISSNIEGMTHTWDAMSGQLIGSSQLYDIATLPSNNTFEVDGTPFHWLPVDNPDFGLWAYVDGKIMRSDKNGSFTILNVPPSLRYPRRPGVVFPSPSHDSVDAGIEPSYA